MFSVDYNKDELPKADLYIMANVIHDHEPEKAKELLTKIHGALNPGLKSCFKTSTKS